MTIEIKVPDIGDFQDVPVIEVLVQPGDTVRKDQGLVTLESDKATLEVPAPAAGTIRAIKVKVDDRVSEGDVVAVLEAAGADASAKADGDAPAREESATDGAAQSTSGPSAEAARPEPSGGAAAAAARPTSNAACSLGGGPGGYTAPSVPPTWA